MWHSVLSFVVTFPASVLTTAATIRVARRKGWLVHPRPDRWSRTAVAKFGGVSILLTFSLAVIAFRIPRPLLTVALLTTAMGLVGLVDDIVQLRPSWKFAAQFVIAAVAVWSGIVYQLFHVASLNYAFTFLWILGVTNALNLLDNMDGLAAGVSVIAAGSLLLLGHSSGPMAIGLLAMAASLLGFLVFNFHPAKIFMGDAGSLAVGFFLACCAVSEAGHVSAMFSIVFVPGLVLFLPIFDMLLVSVTRRLNGRAISAGAKDHTSHRLVMLGLSERNAVLTLYLLAALSALVAVLCKRVWSDIGPGILALFLLTATAFWFYLAKIQLPEEWLSRTNALTFLVPEFLNSVGKRAAMVFADAGLIGNPREPKPDKWVEVPFQQALYWRVPTNQGYYDDDPERPVGRHLRRCNGGFADCHGEMLLVSAIGLQYYPGKTINDRSATGIQWLGGNGLFDDRWMWSWGP